MTETAYERVIGALERHGSKVIHNGRGAMAQCPHHEDKSPSLSVRSGYQLALVKCFAGCESADLLADLNLEMSDLFDNRRDATYSYSDGRDVHRRLVKDAGTWKKKFFQVGNTKADKGTASIYRDQEVAAAVVQGGTIYITEGEKDAEVLRDLGLTATTNPGGAGKWSLVDTTPLHGAAEVVIVADRDDPGLKHAEEVRASLAPMVRSVRVVVSNREDLKDAADHVAAGFGPSDFEIVPESVTAARHLRARKASAMQDPPPPRWVAIGWLPFSAVTVLAGDEGIGKSLLWVIIVAHVTTGRILPEIGLPAREPRDVIIVVTEDSWAEVKARLMLAGANMDRVHLLCEEDDGTGSPLFPPDMKIIEEEAKRVRPAMIVLDAWLDTVAGGLKVKDPQQARIALHPWKELATRYECAVMLVVNTNRMTDASTRDRVGATGALRQKARMLLFAAAETEGIGSQLYVGPDKANGTGYQNAVRFDIQVEQVRKATIDDPGTVAMLGRPVAQPKRISGLIDEWRAAEKEASRPLSVDDRAATWLRQYMKEHKGRELATQVQADAAEEGFTPKRIGAALKLLGGVSRALEKGGFWYYELHQVSQDSAVWALGSDMGQAGETGPRQVSAGASKSLPSAETTQTSETRSAAETSETCETRTDDETSETCETGDLPLFSDEDFDGDPTDY